MQNKRFEKANKRNRYNLNGFWLKTSFNMMGRIPIFIEEIPGARFCMIDHNKLLKLFFKQMRSLFEMHLETASFIKLKFHIKVSYVTDMQYFVIFSFQKLVINAYDSVIKTTPP